MIGSVNGLEFGVFFRLDGRRQFDTLTAPTPHTAVAAAEAAHPGCRVESVSVRMNVVGKCVKCGMIVFAEERHRQTVNGTLCSDCEMYPLRSAPGPADVGDPLD